MGAHENRNKTKENTVPLGLIESPAAAGAMMRIIPVLHKIPPKLYDGKIEYIDGIMQNGPYHFSKSLLTILISQNQYEVRRN